jgi:hypothetical protein
MKTQPKMTQQRLKELCLYDPSTGTFTWIVPRRKCSVGAIVGSKETRGYLVAKIDYQRYYVHRLAWLYMTGDWPVDEIDHIDMNKSNNKWENLRSVSTKQNMENVGLKKSNRTGVTGVSWSKTHGYWLARIKHNYKSITIGYFKDFDSAVDARKKAEKRLFTHAPPQA